MGKKNHKTLGIFSHLLFFGAFKVLTRTVVFAVTAPVPKKSRTLLLMMLT